MRYYESFRMMHGHTGWAPGKKAPSTSTRGGETTTTTPDESPTPKPKALKEQLAKQKAGARVSYVTAKTRHDKLQGDAKDVYAVKDVASLQTRKPQCSPDGEFGGEILHLYFFPRKPDGEFRHFFGSGIFHRFQTVSHSSTCTTSQQRASLGSCPTTNRN